MAFGQPAGPPATGKQIQQLLALLNAAGHSDFRDARGPMGFNQRQAGGKFTRDEAEAYIAQLEAEAEGGSGAAAEAESAGQSIDTVRSSAAPSVTPRPKGDTGKITNAEAALRKYPANLLAAELQRRGWVVMEP